MNFVPVCDAVWSWFKSYTPRTKKRRGKLSEFIGFAFSKGDIQKILPLKLSTEAEQIKPPQGNRML